MNRLYLDTETTGLPSPTGKHNVVSFAIKIVDRAGQQLCRYYTLIQPPVGCSWPASSKYHKVTDADAKKYGVPIAQALAHVEHLAGVHAVAKVYAYNAHFDRYMLTHDAGAAVYRFLTAIPWHCVLKMARDKRGGIEGRKRLCDVYAIAIAAAPGPRGPTNFHDAEFDVDATIEVHRHLSGVGVPDPAPLAPRAPGAALGKCGAATKKRDGTPCMNSVGMCCYH